MSTTKTDRLDGVIASLAVKAPVVTATTANITLSGVQTIDGISCVSGDRVLVKDQTDATENGIYDVSTGSWTRSLDFDGARDVVCGTLVYVPTGTINGLLWFCVSTSDPITIGETQIFFAITRNGNVRSIRDYGAAGDGIADDSGAFAAAGATTGNVLVGNGTYKISGTVTNTANFLGDGNIAETVINLSTAQATDFAFEMQGGSALRNLTINSTVSTTNPPNRSNCLVQAGPRTASSDVEFGNITLEDLVVTRGGVSAPLTNCIQFNNNVYDAVMRRVNITGDFVNGTQFHWNYNGDSTGSNHPRRIVMEDIKIKNSASPFNAGSIGASWRGCHDIDARNLIAENCGNGFVITPGDAGELVGPSDESKNKLFSNMVFSGLRMENCKNEGVWFVGYSYPVDAGTDNTRWIAADSPSCNITIDNLTNLRGAESTNNTTLYLTAVKNVDARNVTTDIREDASATNTTGAIVVDASHNCRIESASHCAVAADLLSGRNIRLELDHTNSDTANSAAANGVTVRGVLHTAGISGAVSLNGTSVTFASIPCNIFNGMRMYDVSGNEFVARSTAICSSTSAHNTNITIAIDPAPAALDDGAELSLMYCADDVKITGRIKGANKGVRVIGNDARMNRNIEIDCEFEECASRNIEVLNGITVKYHGTYYFDNAGGTWGITPTGAVTPSTVIRYNKVGDKKIGYGSAAPTAGTWVIGDIIYNSAATTSSIGWICTTAGSPGTWTAFYAQGAFSAPYESVSATIASGVVNITSKATRVEIQLDTEGGAAADDLTDITGMTVGQEIVLKPANTSRVITIKHNTAKILLNGGADFVFGSTAERLFLHANSATVCLEKCRRKNV